MRPLRVLVLCAVALALLVGAAAATPARVAIVVSPSSVSPGQVVRLSGSAGSGCARGDSVTLISELFPGHAFGGEGAISIATRSTGAFSRRYRVPAATGRGAYAIGGRCGGGNLGVSATLHVR